MTNKTDTVRRKVLTSSPYSVEKKFQMVLTELVGQNIVLGTEERRREPQHCTHRRRHSDDAHEPETQRMSCLNSDVTNIRQT